jgi:hypothetical protein
VIDAYPVYPLARTPRMLARALAGHSIETVIARGTIALGDNGNAPIELRSDRYQCRRPGLDVRCARRTVTMGSPTLASGRRDVPRIDRLCALAFAVRRRRGADPLLEGAMEMRGGSEARAFVNLLHRERSARQHLLRVLDAKALNVVRKRNACLALQESREV